MFMYNYMYMYMYIYLCPNFPIRYMSQQQTNAFLRCLERFLHGGLRDFGRGHLGEFFERRGGRLVGGRRQ